ncbi:diaminopimelate epimerase [Prochlorococcus marinus]|uniref:diaminopimelate epimerase n=1 Tax=Prochlorococcus marinus TaxID=1219 RepID=UPI0022B4785C|nr:diaminopimelate epimerase [Prochlorococcus marinus]
MTPIKFKKYEGTGNDFIIIDGFKSPEANKLFSIKRDLIKSLCDRHYGVGADGIIINAKPDHNGISKMIIYNSDGSLAEMCGNGIRCLVKYIIDTNNLHNQTEFNIETLAGLLNARFQTNGDIKVNMGEPTFTPNNIPTTLATGKDNLPTGIINIENTSLQIYAAGMGNPHLVTFIDDFDSIRFEKLGPVLENSSYFPEKTNVHFVKIVNRETLELLVWERGCGPTLACGTGACASLAVSATLQLCNEKANIILPGGTLFIEWPNKSGDIYMSGPAKYVFSGSIEI